MASPSADGKQFVNAVYHGAVVSALAGSYAVVGKKALGGPLPRLGDFTPRDMGMVIADVSLAIMTRDWLVKQGYIPANIMQ